MRWFYPWFFALLPLLGVLWFIRAAEGHGPPGERRPVDGRLVAPRAARDRTRLVLNLLYGLALLLVTLALTRPPEGSAGRTNCPAAGSTSCSRSTCRRRCRAEDFQPDNRLYVAKQVAQVFRQPGGRHDPPGDSSCFAGTGRDAMPADPEPRCADRAAAARRPSAWSEDGTAIGQGARETSLNRLRPEPRQEARVVILLTDGR